MPFRCWPKRFPRIGQRKKQRNNNNDERTRAAAVSDRDSLNRELPSKVSSDLDAPNVVTNITVSRNDSANSAFVPTTAYHAPDPPSVTTSDIASSAFVKNASETPTKITAAATVLHGLQEAFKIVKEVSDACPPLKAVVGGLLACVEAYQKTAANQEEMERLIKSIDVLASLVARRLEWMHTTKVLQQRMEQLASDLKDIVKDIEDLQARRFVVRLVENSVNAGKLVAAYQQVVEILHAFQLEVGLEIERNVHDIFKEVVIRDLPRSRHASFGAAIKTDTLSRGPCTSGTRVDILDKIMAWARADDADSPPVFWLTGLAGTGKTTIAYTICERMERENKPFVSFFCSHQLDSKDSHLIVPTISRYLAEIFRSYATELVRVLQGASVLDEARIRAQIDKLLVAPWTASLSRRDGLPTPVVVIDALDESNDGVEFLKNLFRIVADKSLMRIKFLVTSRAEPEIVKLFDSNQLPADTIRLHEVPLVDVQDDIAKFLAAQLPEVDVNERAQLTQRAAGLFIYAATAVRFISPPGYQRSSDEQREKFQELLEHGAPSGLGELYKQVLSIAFREEDDNFLRRRFDILHAVVCAQELISVPVIAQLLSLSESTTMACVNSLHSVLYVSPLDCLVSCYHASFPEFILDAQRLQFPSLSSSTTDKSRELQVFCDKPVFDARLARHCFRIMRSELCFNICRLPSSSLFDCKVPNLHDLVQIHISPVLRYAACHWGEHLLGAGHMDTGRSSLHDGLKTFLTNVFLYWLEAMNLIGSKSLCFPLLRLAREWLKPEAESDISALVDDATSFATSFTGSPASQSTPHLYISCLSTWSSSAPLSKIWKPRFSQLPLFLPGPIDTAPLLTIPDFAATVAFSRDDLKVASGRFNVIKIWDSTTGEELQKLMGHAFYITSMAFSNDGAYLLSGSDDKSIRIWDLSIGRQLKELLGHTSWVNAVAFSHDNQYIVSGSQDKSVRVWIREPKTGSGQLHQLDGHISKVVSVVFSDDDTQVVSCSEDGSVRIWDVKMGQQVRELIGHTCEVLSVAFSPCRSRITSVSADSIRIWDASTGTELNQFSIPTPTVKSVAFSYDRRKIVLGSWSLIQIWDVMKGELLNELIGHSDSICSVMFSHDGTRLVSSGSGSIHIWNMMASQRLERLKGHTDPVESVAFSSDGKRVISSAGSRDKTIQIWDGTTGRELKQLKYPATHYNDSACKLALSSDGALACFVARRRVGGPHWHISHIFIWDTASRTLLSKQCVSDHREVTCLSFSPDGTRIITGLDTGSLIIWDSRTGAQLRHLEGHTKKITSVAFFPDGLQLVSGSRDGSIRTWDMSKGENTKVLTGYTGDVTSLAVSIDGKQIVSSGWRVLSLWDVETGECSKVIDLGDSVESVAFLQGLSIHKLQWLD